MTPVLSRRRALATGAATLALPHVARAAKATVNFWDMIWGPQEYIDAAKKLVDRFNAENANIEVRYRSVPWANWYQTFVTAISAGTAPDISTGAGYQAVQLFDQDAIAPIDDVIAQLRASGDVEDFAPGTVDRLRYQGKYVALPWAMDVRVWYARRDYLEAAKQAPPTSMATLRAAARAMTTPDHAGIVGSGDTGGSHYIYSAVLNNGGGLFTPDRKPQLDAPRNKEAMAWLAGMVADGSFSPASAGYASVDRRRVFFQGQAAMILDGPGLMDQQPDLVPKVTLLSPLEGLHGDRGTVLWVNNIMLYSQSKLPAESRTFLMWWSKNARLLWTEGHSTVLPARKSIQADPYFTGNAIRNAVLRNYVPIAKGTGTFADGIFPKLNELEGEGLMQNLMQDILQKKDLDAAIAKARGRLAEIML